MNTFTAIIVDDEIHDRNLLKKLCTTYCSKIKVVGEAGGVAQALELVNRLKPGIVFLDIQMRGETGFQLLQQWNHPAQTRIVFTTGYDQYGIMAVKAGAFDYLLKPIDVDELEQLEQKLIKLHESPPVPAAIPVLQKGTQSIVPVQQIAYLQAQGSYCKICMGNGEEYTVSKNLKQVQEELNNTWFIQIHRSVIVNKQWVNAIRNNGNEALLTLRNGMQLPVSRSYKAETQKQLF
ncbi:MAG: response regulator transcription factor [Dinghuibacter sp.]|nr:response regulator transcription factor [Dinghuibacter sp.]